MNDLERGIESMKREPWKYWDRKTLEWIVTDLSKNANSIRNFMDSIDPRMFRMHDEMNALLRAYAELLETLGFPKQLNHPSTQPVGMGEESAP